MVTGAAGFVGSHTAAYFEQMGHSVLAIDNFNQNYAKSLKELRVSKLLSNSKVDFVELNLCDRSNLNEILVKFSPDTIIHLAAQPGVRTPIEESFKYIDNNIVAFSNVLQLAVENRIKNFIYASSSSVYGNSLELPYKEENQKIAPISIYGSTKRANEILTSSYVRNSATRARGLRFFTVYGPMGRPDMAYFRIISSALNNKVFQLYGDGKILRDFTFIDDIVRMTYGLTIDLVNRTPGYHDIVNIGGGNPHSMLDLINTVEKLTNLKIHLEYFQTNQNDTIQTCADTQLLKSLTNFSSFEGLESGIRKVIDWTLAINDKTILEKWIESTN